MAGYSSLSQLLAVAMRHTSDGSCSRRRDTDASEGWGPTTGSTNGHANGTNGHTNGNGKHEVVDTSMSDVGSGLISNEFQVEVSGALLSQNHVAWMSND